MAYVINRGTKAAPRWYGKFKDLDGRWKQKASGQTTKTAALAWVREIEARVRRGLIGVPETTPEDLAARTMTVTGLCERFLIEYHRPRIKSMDGYRLQVRAVINRMVAPFAIASMTAAQVRRADVERWRCALIETGYSPHSVNRAWAVLSRAYNWAADMEILVVRSPLSRMELMRVQPSEEHFSMEEVHRLLALPDLPPMVWTALYTGMRKGELFGLTWGCVRLDGEYPRIDVRRSYRTLPKSGKSRVVPLHPDLLPVLRRWRELCPAMPDGLVFPVSTKGSAGRMGVPRDLCGLPELLRAAGCHVPREISAIPGRKCQERVWHALRHTFATHFLEASGNGDALSKILGHTLSGSGAAVVTTGYTHTSVAYLARELAKMTLLPPAPARVSSLDEARRQRKAS